MKESYRIKTNSILRPQPPLWGSYQRVVFVSAVAVPKKMGMIITAFNPHGINCSVEQNRHYQFALLRYLRYRQKPFITLWGSAPDHTHAEHSLFVSGSLMQGVRMARRFKQLAFYFCRHGQLYLVDSYQPYEWLQLGDVTNFWHRQPLREKMLARLF